MNLIDKKILAYLKKNGKATTYRLSTDLHISWGTIISHCYKLKSEGLIDFTEIADDIERKKKIWFLTKR